MTFTIDTVFVWVADIDCEVAWYRQLGIDPVDSEVTDTGAARFITYRDPDGNEIQLLERHG